MTTPRTATPTGNRTEKLPPRRPAVAFCCGILSAEGAGHFSPGQRPGSAHQRKLSPEGAAQFKTGSTHATPSKLTRAFSNYVFSLALGRATPSRRAAQGGFDADGSSNKKPCASWQSPPLCHETYFFSTASADAALCGAPGRRRPTFSRFRAPYFSIRFPRAFPRAGMTRAFSAPHWNFHQSPSRRTPCDTLAVASHRTPYNTSVTLLPRGTPPFLPHTKALKGRVISAQGNALGYDAHQYGALKGRLNFDGVTARATTRAKLTRAFSALNSSARLPGALPRAEMTRAFSAFRRSFYHAPFRGAPYNTLLRVGTFAAAFCLCVFVTSAQDVENFFYAVEGGDVEAVENFIANNADVNSRNDKGETPLISAAANAQTAVVETLLAAGAKVNDRDNDGNTALIKACGAKQGFATVQLLLKAGADIYAANKEDKLAYDVAIESGAQLNLRMLVAPDEPTPRERKREQLNAMLEAISKKDMETFHDLLGAGLDLNSKMENNVTLLNVAIVRGNTDMVRALCAAGADVNLKGKVTGREPFDVDPLQFTVSYNRVEAAKILLESGADLARSPKSLLENCVKRLGIRNTQNPHWTFNENASAVAKLLLAAGADPNLVPNSDGVTPLMGAAIHGDTELARMFIKAGANLDAVDEFGFAALNIAQYTKNAKMVELLQEAGAVASPIALPPGYGKSFESQKDFLRKLLRRKTNWHDKEVFNVYSKNRINLGFAQNSAEHLRAWESNFYHGSLEMLQFLLDNGVDPNALDIERKTALHNWVLVTANDYIVEGIEFLLQHGANPNAKNRLGNSPFLLLFNKRRDFNSMDNNERVKKIQTLRRLTKAFLAAGADVNLIGEQHGNTPLHLAILWHDAEIVKMLLDAGANPLVVDNYGDTPYSELRIRDIPNFTPEFQRLLDTHFIPKP